MKLYRLIAYDVIVGERNTVVFASKQESAIKVAEDRFGLIGKWQVVTSHDMPSSTKMCFSFVLK